MPVLPAREDFGSPELLEFAIGFSDVDPKALGYDLHSGMARFAQRDLNGAEEWLAEWRARQER